jgi:hypothetical protein
MPSTTPSPPFRAIADLLKRGEVVPLLGAGVNFGHRPARARYQEGAAFLPSGAELSRLLADQCSFPSKEGRDRADLAKVSSYFEETTGRPVLRRQLREVFRRDYQTCAIHRYLAEVEKPLLIVTTNYDDLMESALRDAGRPFDLVVHAADRKDLAGSVLWQPHGAAGPEAVPPNQLYIDLEKTTVVYKMHGSVDRLRDDGDGYVITEDDYVDFLSRMTGQSPVPSHFMKHFRSRHFLFMGYGLGDWNFRVILKNLKNPPGSGEGGEGPGDELMSWAIQFRPSLFERELWGSRGVKIYDVDIDGFVDGLRASAPKAGAVNP